MSFNRTIGLVPAILININVVIGGGIFMNLAPLITYGGALSFVAYLGAALFLFPVVWVLALLARRHPESGGLFVYTKTYLHPFVGFLCGWGYFVGKAISVGLIVHTLVGFAEQAFPLLRAVPHVALVGAALLFIAGANIAGAAIQGRAQWFFIAAKALPVACAVGAFTWYGRQVALETASISVDTLSLMLPIAVFAMVGFEVTCAIAHLFERPSYTIPRAFLIGFSIVAVTIALFQLSVSGLVSAGTMGSFVLGSLADAAFPSLQGIGKVLFACVCASMAGGSFSILTSNCWNLHRLASHGYLPMSHWLTKTTAGQVPWVSLLTQTLISLSGVVISTQQVPLQKMSVLGVVFAFMCTMVASFYACDTNGDRLIHPLLSLSALSSTVGLAAITLYHIYLFGVSVPYLILFGSGVVAALFCHPRCRRKPSASL